MSNDDSSVRVAVRIRPQVPSEVIDMCRVCTRVAPGEPQVTLGQDKSFTFDRVFDTGGGQREIFECCVESLVRGALDGYNATVLAYGQTGSGKTYTMGTGFEVESSEEAVGIIPRAIHCLFRGIEERVAAARAHQPPLIPPEFKVLAQFMELYNEEIIDLFDPARDHYASKCAGGLRITEDGGGGVRVAGATCKPVRDAPDALACLRHGALARTTAATNMNAASSRSHAVFTLHLKQQRLVRTEETDTEAETAGETTNEFETLTAKFHFVDLAGSERLKRTGATGERAREGISINCGLLALGNVISALGDKSKRASHVPYRDSKLTRLLQDSLGGNSQTVMIACVSPSDRDFMETLNTLKYANRARNIKNKLVVNQDKSSRTISLLRQEVAQLQLELLEFKQGKRILTENGEDGINDLFHENTVLQSELNNLRTRVKAMQGTIDQQSQKNTELLAEKALGVWVKADSADDPATSECGLTALIQGYVREIEELRAKLMEANNMYEILKKNVTLKQQNIMSRSYILSPDVSLLETSTTVLNEAKKELYKEKELLARSMGELEFQRKMSTSVGGSGAGPEEGLIGERERAEGESADDSDHSDDASESEDDDSEDSESKVCAALGAELASLSGDIDMKQRLVEELELSQRRLNNLRRHYEDKLLALHRQIKTTQEERDKVLASYNGPTAPPSDKMARVREEYERKLGEMSRELRRLQTAQREHAKLLRSHAATATQIQTMKHDLQEMKRNKVKLLNKMKEESARHKAAETMRTREIAQLRKESRRNANLIRNLEAERRLKEQVLRRKQEEVSLLRRGHRDKLSSLAAGRKKEKLVRKSAAHKWNALEKALTRATLNRQVVGELECDMERQIAERERLCREREQLRRRAAAAGGALQLAGDLTSELDTVQANINYLQETIAESQQQIMQLEEAKESEAGGGEEGELSALVGNIGEQAASRFVLQKLVELVLQHGYNAARHHKLLQDTQAKLHQMELANERTESALRLAADGGGDYNLNYSAPISPLHAPPTAPLAPPARTDTHHISSGTSTRSVSPVDSTLIELRNDAQKLARLANGDSSPVDTRASPFQRSSNVRGSVRLREIGVYGSTERERGRGAREEDPMTQSMVAEPTHRGQPLARVPSAPGSLKGLQPVGGVARGAVPASPLPARKSYSPLHSPYGEVPASPRLQRRTVTALSLQPPHIGKPLNMEAASAGAAGAAPEWGGGEAPGSPAAARRARDDDVFCRLTTTTASAEHPLGGVVREYQGKWRGAALQCTHVAEGHAGAVLALAAHQRTLYSGGVDRTVRVWDLCAGREVTRVAGHAHAVVCVRVEPRSGLLFSVAGAAVRLSDLRQDPLTPVKTFWSSGVAGGASGGGGARGEVAITDAALNPAATALYTAVNDKLRVWDLRKLECCGKISTGHQAAVMCLAVGATPAGDDLVLTGSKDHYVRALEWRGNSGAAGARRLLEPPHYDGVQSLALVGAALYTGSRDMSVKKWNLDTNELVHSVNGAHKGWVTGVCARADGAVASCGRGGRLRVWDAALRPLAHAHADDAVHALALDQNMLYTAGNGGEVRMWRWSAEQ